MKNSRQSAPSSIRNRFLQFSRHSFRSQRASWGLASLLVLTGALWLGGAAWQRVAAQQVLFNINTVVGGTSTSGLVADLRNARGVAAVSNTIFYIADTDSHVVRRVDTTNNSVTIVAGKLGQAASDATAANGDGGPATNALLNKPYDVAVDVSGDLYISDTGNRKIRKVTFNGGLAGDITTIAGNGNPGVDTSVSGAIFSEPRGLAYTNQENGRLYVADSGNHRVIYIPSLAGLTPNTQITTVAGNGSPGGDGDGGPPTQAGLSSPHGVALDGSRVLIADTNNNKVRVVTTAVVAGNQVSTIETFAGTGSPGSSGESGVALSAQLNAPLDVLVDAQVVYITDTGNHRIRAVSIDGFMTTIAGRTGNGFNGDGSPSTSFTLNSPSGMVAINNSIVFVDSANRRLRRVAGTTISTIVSDGSGGFAGDNGPASEARLDGPSSIAVDVQGNWYIADTNNQVIRKINASDKKISTIAGIPGMASVDPTAANGDGEVATLATFRSPTGVAVDANGNVFVADTGNRRVRRIDRNTQIISTVMGVVGNIVIGAQALVEPLGVAVDGLQNVFVADAAQHIVVAQNGIGSRVFLAGRVNMPGFGGDGGNVENARLNRPMGITSAGGVLYIADSNNHRVRKVERINDIFQIASIVPKSAGVVQIIPRPGFEGDGTNADFARLNSPTGVGLDNFGNLYIVDRGNNRIRRVAPGIDTTTNTQANIINTIVGNGDIGFSGDGGPAVAAAMGLPLNIAITATNEILIADTGNNRIRQATQPPNQKPTLVSPGNKSVNEGQALSFNLQASDPNAGQTLSYSMSFTPPDATPVPTLNAATGAFSWTPGFNTASSGSPTAQFQFTFKVTDSGVPSLESDPVTITVTVNHVNGAPTVNPGTLPSTLEATAPNGAQLPLNGSATDPDGDTPLTAVWTDTRPNQQPVTIATQLSQTVTLGLGLHSLVLTVNDGKGGTTSSPAKAITVQDTTAPVFTNLPNDITDTITSGNGKAVTFSLPTATDAVAGVRPVTATPPSGSTFPVGMTTVTFSASDTAGNTRTATMKVTINCTGTGCGGGGGGGGGGGDPNSPNFNINAFAGNGNFGTSGDGSGATAATLKEPRGVAMDSPGNVYIADHEAHAIRRVNAQGNISLYAGAGVKGFAGDGGTAANARFNCPTGLVVDLTRNLLYIADTGNHRIRRVDLANNTITTFAGTGSAGLGADGPATSTPLNYPSAVAVDSAGAVYLADTGNNRIVKVSNGTLTTIAGTGQVGSSGDAGAPTQARLNHPTGVAVTSDGTMIYVADRGNNRVRKITATTITAFAGTGNATTSGDGGPAAAAALNAPTDVAVDSAGNVYITETDGERIRRINTSNVISTIAGNGTAGNTGDDGPAINATLNTPTALVRNSTTGVIFFCDTANLRVRRLLPSGTSNNAPVPAPVGNVQLGKAQTSSVALSATDADGDSVTFALVPALTFVSITNANAAARTATLFVNPNNGNVGVYNVRVQATDSKGGTGQTPEFTISVTDPNNNPPSAVMNSLPATVFAPSGSNTAAVSLNGAGSNDPDGDTLTYAWFDGTTQIATGITATVQLALGQHSIRLVVTDSKGASGSTAAQSVTVQATTTGNSPPVARIKNLPAEITAFGASVSVLLDGSDSTDPNNDPLSYRWFDGQQEIATGITATVSLTPGQHNIRLVVTDDKNASGEASQTVTVVTGSAALDIDSLSPNSGKRGKIVMVMIHGRGFTSNTVVTITKGGILTGSGITVTTSFISSTQLSVRLAIAENAPTGGRIVTLTNPSGETATLPNGFTVTLP